MKAEPPSSKLAGDSFCEWPSTSRILGGGICEGRETRATLLLLFFFFYAEFHVKKKFCFDVFVSPGDLCRCRPLLSYLIGPDYSFVVNDLVRLVIAQV